MSYVKIAIGAIVDIHLIQNERKRIVAELS
jgi:hypothetical protein